MTTKTTKSTILLASLILTVCVFAIMPQGINAESVSLTTQEQDLVPSNVLDYEVKALSPTDLKHSISVDNDISIPFKGKTYDLYLMEYNLRSADAVAGIHTEKGIQSIPLEDISTYRGYVRGDSDSNVFLLVSDSVVGGFISTSDDEITIESLNQRTKEFATDKQIMYSIHDVDLDGVYVEQEDESEYQQRISGNSDVNRLIPYAYATSWTADIILDCDWEFSDEYGSWQAQQLLVLGGVDQAFDDADDGDFSAAAHYCDTGHDDYTDDTAEDLTDQLRDYWDGLGNDRDLVVLYSGQDLYDVNRDFANAEAINGLQDTADEAYASLQTVNAVDTSDFSASLLEQKILMSHEIGHLFNCEHSDASSDSIMTNPWSGSMTLDFSGACASKISDAADNAGL